MKIDTAHADALIDKLRTFHEFVNKEGANLQGADLRGVNLRGANLSGADLRYCDMEGADLSYANLSYANLSRASMRLANLYDANMEGADLSYTNLTYANLAYANLAYTNLTYTNLTYTEMTRANLHGANMELAHLHRTRLKDARLDGSHASVTIPDIHKRVYEAAVVPGALEMDYWHSDCGTAHCRAGWVVTLAGEAGKEMEAALGTSTAAALIYQASDPDLERIPDFYVTNNEALADMKRLAEGG